MKCELGTMHDHARGPAQVDLISELIETGYINVNRDYDPRLRWLPNKGHFTTYGNARVEPNSFWGLHKRLRDAGYILVACKESKIPVAYGWRKEEAS